MGPCAVYCWQKDILTAVFNIQSNRLHFSAEKIGEEFAFTWVRFVCFVEEKEEWLQPKATIEAKGDLEISVYNERLNLGCKVAELSQWEKKPYQPNN